MKIYCTAFGLMLLALNANAVSFDCNKASTPIEKAICSDPLLGKLDDVLSANYKYMRTRNIGGDDAKKDLWETQKSWFAARNKCATIACLVDSYKQRIDEICTYPGVHPMCTSSEEVAGETKASEPVVQPESVPVPYIKPEIRARYKHMGGIEYCENDKDFLCNFFESVYEYNSQEEHHLAFVAYEVLHKGYFQNLNPQQKYYEQMIKHNERFRNILNKNPTLKTSGKTLFQNAQNEAIRIGGSLNLTPDRVEAINFFSNFQ